MTELKSFINEEIGVLVKSYDRIAGPIKIE